MFNLSIDQKFELLKQDVLSQLTSRKLQDLAKNRLVTQNSIDIDGEVQEHTVTQELIEDRLSYWNSFSEKRVKDEVAIKTYSG